MDTESKRQYMKTLRKQYSKSTKKEKTKILDEYCERTGEERKYAIKKFRNKVKVKKPGDRKKRSVTYSHDVIDKLVKVWNIFDRPCGQRLKPMITDELDKLIRLKEISCSDKIAGLLKTISSSSIDRHLRHEKEVLRHNLKYSKAGKDMALLSLVPIKTAADLEKKEPGIVQVDCVEHNGSSASGEYIQSLSTVDIMFGWWEGEAIMGKSQKVAYEAIDNCRRRTPLKWKEFHPDNGSNLLNWHAYEYAKKNNIEISRSRPYKKNDNCFVEQKNSSHVRKHLGYLRFDTPEEQEIINDLYRNELRIYKNFYQPVMKLTEKIRIKGKFHRKYDKPQTPYKRIMESNLIEKEVKDSLTAIYDSFNPAELKRNIDKKINNLYQVYKKKNGNNDVSLDKKLVTATVSYYLIHQL